MDLVDVFLSAAQKEHRNFTCTPSNKGIFQQTVLIMLLIKWVFNRSNVEHQAGAVIIASTGAKIEVRICFRVTYVSQSPWNFQQKNLID